MLCNINLKPWLTTLLMLFAAPCFAEQYYQGVLKKVILQDADTVSINAGNSLSYDKLVFTKPIKLTATNDDNLPIAIDHVDGFQINTMAKKFELKYSVPVRIRCADLYTANSMYHYTEVICQLKSISYLDDKGHR